MPCHPVPSLQHNKRAVYIPLSLLITCGCQGFTCNDRLKGGSLITSTNIMQEATVVELSVCKDKGEKPELQ